MLHSIQRAYARIMLELEPPAAIVTLNHPPLNVIDAAMVSDLTAALEFIEERADISMMLLSGGEENFSAGVDIKAHAPEQIADMLHSFHTLLRQMARSRFVTVASVRGNCLGGGAELALTCDLVFCSENSRWGFPEINLGCFPPVAVAMLGELIGRKRAAEMLLTGNIVEGDEAFAMGMVNDATPAEELDELVREVADRLRSLSPKALALTKKALYASPIFDQALGRIEAIFLDELMQTHDAREGIRAWVEKRAPHWTGR